MSRPGAGEDMPFGDSVVVFKVAGKMFGLLSLDEIPPTINLKCDPDRALHLRDTYPAVQPGYHMNKKHWNTITADGSIPRTELLALIDHSYDLVVAGLPRAQRAELLADR